MLYKLQPADETYLEDSFKSHPPHSTQIKRYSDMREGCKIIAEGILISCPPSRERSLALTNIEQAMFWANAAIARNEKWDPEAAC